MFHTPMSALHPDKGGKRYKDIGKSFDAAVKRADATDFHFHDLRHTFASRFIMAGGSVTTLKEILGHKSLTMTLRYAHLSPEHTAASVSIIDKMYVPAEEGKGQPGAPNPGQLYNYCTIGGANGSDCQLMSAKCLKNWEPAVGIEPTTCRLRISCSTTELRRPAGSVKPQ